ncbi:MAG: thiolase family protein [Firmicutes bacterium]|nr:thiolase family protein [Bacillota bacterium]
MGVKRVAIVGYGTVEIGRHRDRTEGELALEVVRGALLDAGLTKDRIEGVFTTPDLRENIGMQGNLLCEYLRISPKIMAEMACGALAVGLNIRYAIEEIKSGRIQVALCYGASREGTVGWFKKNDPGYGWPMLDPTALQPFGAYGVIWSYAMSARRYMHETGATEEDFARAAVRNRRNAAGSAVAAFRNPITVEDVMRSRPISTPIKMLDTSVATDGAAAVLLASEEVARDTKKQPVYFLSLGNYHDNACIMPTDGCRKSITQFTATRQAAARAFSDCGLKPADIDVAELYAPFSPHELMIPEDIGWFERGEMVRAIREGDTEIGGRIPINTDGGLISRGHPWAVTPYYQLANLVRQLRGEAGANQVAGARTALAHSEGGMLNNGMVMILGRD